jgi:AcrR family transcriptional regulator
MPNQPSNAPRGVERRSIFIRIIADAFVECGFRGTTTAELARRCSVRENELYRIWPSKKQMFLDSIDYVYSVTTEAWSDVLNDDAEGGTSAQRVLAFQSRDHGKMRLYRIIFAGLTESEDKEIRAALRSLYRKFLAFLTDLLTEHRKSYPAEPNGLDAELSTWAIIGIGTIVDIQRELGLLNKSERERFMRKAAGLVLGQDN